jgi:hypothetical protein
MRLPSLLFYEESRFSPSLPWPSSPTRPRLPSRPGSHLVSALKPDHRCEEFMQAVRHRSVLGSRVDRFPHVNPVGGMRQPHCPANAALPTAVFASTRGR